jgi:WD40 repeat protein
MKTIDTPIMTAWKMEYVGNEVVVCGDLGRIHFYDYATGEHKRKLEAGELHLTSLTKSNDEQLLAAGNSAGGCFLFNLGKKDRSTVLKPHHHLLRSLSFTEDSTKLLTASDDCMLSVIDIASEKVVSVLEGHKEAVSGVRCHPEDSRVVISCSFDKSFKSWDLRMKGCTGTQNTGSQVWSCAVLGKQVLVGGDNSILSVYAME